MLLNWIPHCKNFKSCLHFFFFNHWCAVSPPRSLSHRWRRWVPRRVTAFAFLSYKIVSQTLMMGLSRICRCRPPASRRIPAEDRRWALCCSRATRFGRRRYASNPRLVSCVHPLQSCWRRKKSWWIARCTCSPWAWPRPSSSRGSCRSWSSEVGAGRRGETTCAVARGSWRGSEK